MARSVGRKWGAFLALLLAGSLLLSLSPTQALAQGHGRRRHLVALTNQDREQHKRNDLRFNAALSRYAKRHSRAMADKGYLFHSDEATLRRVLAPYDWSIGGENVGVGSSLDGLEGAFMASKEHRQNILRKTYDHVAVGIVHVDDRLWVTVIFYG